MARLNDSLRLRCFTAMQNILPQETNKGQQKTQALETKDQQRAENKNDQDEAFIAEFNRKLKTTTADTRKRRHPLDEETLESAHTEHSRAKKTLTKNHQKFSNRCKQRAKSKIGKTPMSIKVEMHWEELKTAKSIKHRSQYKNALIQQNKKNQIIASNHALTANST